MLDLREESSPSKHFHLILIELKDGLSQDLLYGQVCLDALNDVDVVSGAELALLLIGGKDGPHVHCSSEQTQDHVRKL
jgi:hypothetical protein